MTSVPPAPRSLTVGPLRPVILQLAAPAVAMMACHFCFNLIDSIWVGRLIGPAALAAVSTAGFYVWVLLSLGEMVEVGLIAVAARRHGEGRPDLAARAAGAAVLYALGAGTAASRSSAGSSGSTSPTGGPCPRCSAWAPRSPSRVCSSPWCTCGSRGTPRASGPPRWRRSG